MYRPCTVRRIGASAGADSECRLFPAISCPTLGTLVSASPALRESPERMKIGALRKRPDRAARHPLV